MLEIVSTQYNQLYELEVYISQLIATRLQFIFLIRSVNMIIKVLENKSPNMALRLKELKKINDTHKFTVFGYAKRVQKESSLTIPLMINYLCLAYYFHGEYFEKCGNNLEISNGAVTLTKIGKSRNWRDTAYGKIWIKSNMKQVASWKFRIDKIPDYDEFLADLYIYFVSHATRMNDDCAAFADRPFYGFDNKGASDASGIAGVEPKCDGIPEFNQGDIIIISLDTSQAIIQVKIRDEDAQIIYRNIYINDQIQYKIAVQLWGQNTSITLLDFCLSFQ